MNVFTDPLEDLKAYIELKTCLEQGETGGETDRHLPGALADSCVDSQKAHLIFALSREESLKDSARFRLVLTYSDLRASDVCGSFDTPDPALGLPGQHPGDRETGHSGSGGCDQTAGLHGI